MPRRTHGGAAALFATAVTMLAAGCTSGSDGTQILRSTVPGESASASVAAVTKSSESGPSAARSSPAGAGGPSIAATAVTVTPPPSSSSGVCHDPNHPDQVYDCDSPPHTFPGDHAAYVTAITVCMAKRGWQVTMTGTGIAAPPGLSAERAQEFSADAAACVASVGLYSIANASDAEISRAYRELRQQWTCLKDQHLPVKPFPTLAAVLTKFHRSHELTLDPLAGVDRDVGLSYCPSPQIPGLSQPPPSRSGH